MRIIRVCLLAAVVATATVVIAPPSAFGQLLSDAGDSTLPAEQATSAITVGAAVALWTVAGWLAVVALLLLGAQLPGTVGRGARHVGSALTPRLLHRALRVGLVAGAGAPLCAVAHPAVAIAAPSATAPTCSDLPSLDRVGCVPAVTLTMPTGAPTSAPPATTPSAARTAPAAPMSVVVGPGDSLWRLAERDLRERTSRPVTAAEIARRWPQWWQANSDAIADAGLIHPGQVLRVPALSTPNAPEASAS
jgi:nucleoid-associated protein YgaU